MRSIRRCASDVWRRCDRSGRARRPTRPWMPIRCADAVRPAVGSEDPESRTHRRRVAQGPTGKIERTRMAERLRRYLGRPFVAPRGDGENEVAAGIVERARRRCAGSPTTFRPWRRLTARRASVGARTSAIRREPFARHLFERPTPAELVVRDRARSSSAGRRSGSCRCSRHVEAMTDQEAEALLSLPRQGSRAIDATAGAE